MDDLSAAASGAVSLSTARRLQVMIRDAAFPAGEPIPPQRTLAQSFGVSRASLREALSMLETMGTLETRPRRGTFVVGATVEHAAPLPGWRFGQMYSAAEVYQFRFVAESYAARLTASRATSEDVDKLRGNLKAFEHALRERRILAVARLDFDFHHLIMALSSNRMFADLHASYGSLMQESQRIALRSKERLWEPLSGHKNIVNAIAHRDPDGAAYFMQVHLLRAADRSGTELTDATG